MREVVNNCGVSAYYYFGSYHVSLKGDVAEYYSTTFIGNKIAGVKEQIGRVVRERRIIRIVSLILFLVSLLLLLSYPLIGAWVFAGAVLMGVAVVTRMFGMIATKKDLRWFNRILDVLSHNFVTISRCQVKTDEDFDKYLREWFTVDDTNVLCENFYRLLMGQYLGDVPSKYKTF